MSKLSEALFTRYYTDQFWGNDDGSSGPNSAYDSTHQLRANLQRLFYQLEIKSIFDAGCGDANLMKHMDMSGIEYKGMDCVQSMITHNQDYFKEQDNVSFVMGDVTEESFPRVDLILSRDVLHYLPNELIDDFLLQVINSKSRYLLVTHNIASNDSANSETELGVFRPVNLTCPPFSLPLPMLTIEEDVANKELALWPVADLGAL